MRGWGKIQFERYFDGRVWWMGEGGIGEGRV